MTWVQGITQWGTLAYDLNRIICGEVPDGNGVTVAADDRWVRDQTRTVTDAVITAGSTTVTSASAAFTADDVTSFFTSPGIPAGAAITAATSGTTAVISAPATVTATGVTAQIHTDTIRTPSSVNVVPADAGNRCGYFTAIGGEAAMIAPATAALAGGPTTVIRLSGVSTGPLAAGVVRWLWRLAVSAQNTVPGNYSNAQITGTCLDLDTNTSYAHNATYTPNAAGVFTGPAGTQVTVSDPSGIVSWSYFYVRAFSPAYPGGVDWWPMLHRSGGNPTFTIGPPGVQGTDWDISRGATQYAWTNNTQVADRGSVLYGLGVKTATALTGARYTTKLPLALGKARVYQSTTGLSLDVGGSKKDEASAVIRLPHGCRIPAWARLFTAAPPNSCPVRYRISVTATGIVAVIDGDPGYGGKQATAYYCRYTPADTKYEVLPMAFNWMSVDYTVDQTGNNFYAGVQHAYWPLRRRQDGTADAVRDWQTGFMRGEMCYASGSSNMNGSVTSDLSNSVGACSLAGTYTMGIYLTAPGMASNSGGQSNAAMHHQPKPSPDGRWWLYPVNLAEGDPMNNSPDQIRKMRGTLDRFCYIPEDGWTAGDELTDTTTGDKWLLLKPDYMGTGSRPRVVGPAVYGGVAIREA